MFTKMFRNNLMYKMRQSMTMSRHILVLLKLNCIYLIKNNLPLVLRVTKMAVFFSKLTAEGVNFVSAWVAKEFNFNSALAILAFLSSHDALFSFNYYWSSPIAVAGYSDQWWSVHPVKKGDTISEWAISRVVEKYIIEFH